MEVVNSKSLTFFSTLVVLLLFLTSSSADPSSSSSDIVAELLALESRSESGVIELDDNLVRRFVTGSPTPRPYWLLIFFDAVHLHSSPDLHLLSLLSEFRLLSSSFISHHSPSNPSILFKLFFCRLEFRSSQPSFALFGVNALPHIRLLPPDTPDPLSSLQMDPSHFSRLADSMADFVESRTGLPLHPILRPPPLSRPQLLLILLALSAAAPFLLRRLLSGHTPLHDPRLWLSLSVFVYFFSVAGTMHNIIRKMPMFLTDREDPSRLQFFYQGSGMQLGAEGFAVGFLYTVVGLLLGLATHVLVLLRNPYLQRGFMFFAITISFWAVRKVIYLDNWKTGYAIHGYWPSSWI